MDNNKKNKHQNDGIKDRRIQRSKLNKSKHSRKNDNKKNKKPISKLALFFQIFLVVFSSALFIYSMPEDVKKRIEKKTGITAVKEKVEEVETDLNTMDSKAYIIRHLKKEGYSDYAIASIMGAWVPETGLSPFSLEGVFDKNKAIETSKRIFNDSTELNNYMIVLFSAYKTQGFPIDKSAYLVHGEYWPAFGVAQWTGTRTYRMLHFDGKDNFDEDISKKWYSIKHQMDYFDWEMDPESKYSDVWEGYGDCTSYYNHATAKVMQEFKDLGPRGGETDHDCIARGITGFRSSFEGGTTADWAIESAYELYKEISGKKD